ncbi:MAG: hypothetical protein MHPSP_002248, partial [Paramarteilia canceri]
RSSEDIKEDILAHRFPTVAEIIGFDPNKALQSKNLNKNFDNISPKCGFIHNNLTEEQIKFIENYYLDKSPQSARTRSFLAQATHMCESLEKEFTKYDGTPYDCNFPLHSFGPVL